MKRQIKNNKQPEGDPLKGKLKIVRMDSLAYKQEDVIAAVEYLRRGIHIAIPNNWVLRTRVLQEIDIAFEDVVQ